MNFFNILIIGGNEIALVCALSAKKTYPDKDVGLIINNLGNAFINNLFKSGSFSNGDRGITVISDEVISRTDNMIELMSGEKIAFEKIVISTGSEAIKPHIDGVEKEGVYFIDKDPDHILSIRKKAMIAKNIVVFGGDYVGVVVADELLGIGKNVTVIQRSNRLLPSSIDLDVSNEARKIIENQGGRIIFKSKIREVLGADKITGVRLRNDEKLICDFLIICCGEQPNTHLAEKFGLVYDNDRGILVDEYQRTSDKNIFAIGECAARFDFFCGDFSKFILSSTRIEEAKMIGSNIYSVIYNRGRLVDYMNEKKNIQNSVERTLSSAVTSKESQTVSSILNHLGGLL